MTRGEKLEYLIRYLSDGPVPEGEREKWRLFRSLVNVREPGPLDKNFLQVQDDLLQGEAAEKGVVDAADLEQAADGICLWQGDITRMRADAIVNAANSALLGCFCPCHGCIDNAIHTYAGAQLRNACAALMERQGYPEPSGRAKLTPAFNLPARYILHTVGPIVTGPLSRRDRETLGSCYRACLELCAENGLSSVAFCCISTGEFHFPNEKAAEIALTAIRDFAPRRKGIDRVVINVFKDADLQIYQALLPQIFP